MSSWRRASGSLHVIAAVVWRLRTSATPSRTPERATAAATSRVISAKCPRPRVRTAMRSTITCIAGGAGGGSRLGLFDRPAVGVARVHQHQHDDGARSHRHGDQRPDEQRLEHGVMVARHARPGAVRRKRGRCWRYEGRAASRSRCRVLRIRPPEASWGVPGGPARRRRGRASRTSGRRVTAQRRAGAPWRPRPPVRSAGALLRADRPGDVAEAERLELALAWRRGLRVPVARGEEVLLERPRVERDVLVRARLEWLRAPEAARDAALRGDVALAHVEGHAQVRDALPDLPHLLDAG